MAVALVAVELGIIAYIQFRFMETPVLSSVAKVVRGGALVLAAGILIGNG